MRYSIKKLITSSPGFIEIEEQEYNDIKSARKSLIEALFLEEKFDIVMENYLEYEIELLSSSTRYKIYCNQDISWFRKERNLINRRIVNLLSTCRLYLDQSIHHLHNIYGKGSAIAKEVRSEKKNQYDKYLGYRAMEKLRNYSQHRDFPIRSLSYTSRRVDRSSNSIALLTLTPKIDLSYLEGDSNFNPSILSEMKSLGEKIDIEPLIRDYLEGIGAVHNKVREIISDDISKWEEIIQNVITRFQNTFSSDITGLAIVEETEDGTISESAYLFTEFIEQRRELESKNKFFRGLTSRFVTSEQVKNSNHPTDPSH